MGKNMTRFPNYQSQMKNIINECVTIDNDLGLNDITRQDVQDILVDFTTLTIDELLDINTPEEIIDYETETDVEPEKARRTMKKN